MAISSIGVGSGLPLDQLLDDIRKTENQPLVLIQQRQVLNEARLSGYGVIKGSLTDLQKAAQALNKPETYGAHKATSSSESIGITADNKAVAGTYQVNVNSLATHQSLVANGYQNRDQNIGTGGSFTVTLANGDSHTIELGEDTSLQGVMKAINADPKLGVQATLLNDGSADAPYRLMLTATGTGTDASITEIKIENNEPLQALLGVNIPARDENADPAETETTIGNFKVTHAKNASLSINGIDITSQNNNIENVIEGVTLDLKSLPKDGETVKLTVTRDDSVAINAVKEFVKAYNSLLDTIKTQTSYDVENEKSSALTGDSLVRRVESQMRSTLNSAVGTGAIRTLADLGIKTDYKTGKLEIDDKKLTAAVKDNLADVTQFLSGDNGLGKKMDVATNQFIKSNGLIKNAEDSINSNLKMLRDQYDMTADRIDNKMENMRKQFVQLDKMVNQMQGTSNYLAQQLTMLANMNSSQK